MCSFSLEFQETMQEGKGTEGVCGQEAIVKTSLCLLVHQDNMKTDTNSHIQ